MSETQFAATFRSKLEKLATLHGPNYNGSLAKWNYSGAKNAAPTSSYGKPVVSMMQVKLRYLDSASGEVKEGSGRLSRTDKSLTRILQEAAALANCEPSEVTLILDGKTISQMPADKSVPLLVANCGSKNSPVFVFRRPAAVPKTHLSAPPLADNEIFMRDLAALLAVHSHPEPSAAALRMAKHHDSVLSKPHSRS